MDKMTEQSEISTLLRYWKDHLSNMVKAPFKCMHFHYKLIDPFQGEGK